MSKGKVEIPRDVQKEVFERYGGRCIKCGSTEDIQYHHWVPVKRGGTDDADNIVLLCHNCHVGLHFAKRVCLDDKIQTGGRPSKVSCEEAEGTFWRFYNEEIGEKEAKRILGYSEKVHLPDIPLFKRFLANNNLERRKNLVDIREAAPKRGGKFERNSIKRGAV